MGFALAAIFMLAAIAVSLLWMSAYDDNLAPEEEGENPLGEQLHVPAALLHAFAFPLAAAAVCLIAKAVLDDGDGAAPPGRGRRAGRSKDGWRRARDFGIGR